MPELLLEVGCEELPATFVRRAYTDLLSVLTTLLDESAVRESDGLAMGTPRRLIVSFPRLKPRQDDQTREVRGPSLQAAYDSTGAPTAALQGFCRSAGVEVGSVRKDEAYVWATKAVPGLATKELLGELIPRSIRSLQFEKAMRWGAARMRFARPIRWILAAFDGKLVEFEVEGVEAGLLSRGHRFESPEPFQATNLAGLLACLRERQVEPDPDERRGRIVEQTLATADGTPVMDEALVEENVFLTEFPTAVQGAFRDDFLDLPEPVLVTAMAKHEKMFPVRGPDGRLANRFVFIRNSGEDGTVRQGTEWVLNARFNDAKFFHDEDKRHSLDDFLERTATIIFQEKLGTVRERATRLSRLAEELAHATGADQAEAVIARNAGLYAKADLSTGLVSELPSLQGVIGSEYARREGMLEEVCWAIAGHYSLEPNVEDAAQTRAAMRVLMADQLDKLAGYLGLGLAPTGSSDPYGLRRAATLLIEAAWAWKGSLPSFDSLLKTALSLYGEQGVELNESVAAGALADLFAGRYEAMLPEVEHDVLEASILRQDLSAATDPRGFRFRVQCMQRLGQDTAFVQTATRPINIVAAAEKKEVAFARRDPLASLDRAALDSVEASVLLNCLETQQESLVEAAQRESLEEVEELLRSLSTPINRFFDTTMVMVDDGPTRHARLSLLHAAAQQLLVAGDFSKIVIEGQA